MALTAERVDSIDRAVFDRLMEDAAHKAQHEVGRLGGKSNLADSLWGSLQRHSILVYKQDGYICGCASYVNGHIGDENWLMYAYPTFGCDQNNSRAWFYSDDFQKAMHKLCVDEGQVGISAELLRGSPVSQALVDIFGKVPGNYFHEVEVKELHEVWPGRPAINTNHCVYFMRRTDA